MKIFHSLPFDNGSGICLTSHMAKLLLFSLVIALTDGSYAFFDLSLLPHAVQLHPQLATSQMIAKNACTDTYLLLNSHGQVSK